MSDNFIRKDTGITPPDWESISRQDASGVCAVCDNSPDSDDPKLFTPCGPECVGWQRALDDRDFYIEYLAKELSLTKRKLKLIIAVIDRYPAKGGDDG